MEEEQDPSPDYIKAFNNGYVLQQHEPELLDKIISNNKENELTKAMNKGKQQYERELFQKEIELAQKKQKNINRER